MGSIPPDDSDGVPCDEAARHDDPPKSLYDHANSFFLSLVDRFDDGRISPPEKNADHRDRQALAQLIAVVAPEDANKLSQDLLKEFGSIGRMLGQSDAALQRILGPNSAVVNLLKATEKFMLVKLNNELPRTLISSTDQRLVTYLQARMGARPVESMHVIFLDNTNHLLGDQAFGDGSPQRMFVQPRNIVKRALEHDASGIILAHNHPGGDKMPSQKDIDFTSSLKALCLELDIRLHDHIIIAGNGWTSLRKLKLL